MLLLQGSQLHSTACCRPEEDWEACRFRGGELLSAWPSSRCSKRIPNSTAGSLLKPVSSILGLWLTIRASKLSFHGKRLLSNTTLPETSFGSLVLAIYRLAAPLVSIVLLMLKHVSDGECMRSPDDGFTIYLDNPEAKTLVYDHVQAVTKRNHWVVSRLHKNWLVCHVCFDVNNLICSINHMHISAFDNTEIPCRGKLNLAQQTCQDWSSLWLHGRITARDMNLHPEVSPALLI
jgi:hypothetical protein